MALANRLPGQTLNLEPTPTTSPIPKRNGVEIGRSDERQHAGGGGRCKSGMAAGFGFALALADRYMLLPKLESLSVRQVVHPLLRHQEARHKLASARILMEAACKQTPIISACMRPLPTLEAYSGAKLENSASIAGGVLAHDIVPAGRCKRPAAGNGRRSSI